MNTAPFPSRAPRRLAAGIALALLTAALAACGGGSDSTPPASTPTPTAPAAPTAPTAPTAPDTTVKPEMRCAP
ncbi:hypothetical protein ACSFA0_20105 [Variovorax sp. LT1P1]|uniref:hypothetical protein n=1 Tax=Variovorax sp. LT1P1 TaxID=3443730 RepID=UPI003F45B734